MVGMAGSRAGTGGLSPTWDRALPARCRPSTRRATQANAGRWGSVRSPQSMRRSVDLVPIGWGERSEPQRTLRVGCAPSTFHAFTTPVRLPQPGPPPVKGAMPRGRGGEDRASGDLDHRNPADPRTPLARAGL